MLDGRLEHILDDGHFLPEQIDHQAEINTVVPALIDDAGRTLRINFEIVFSDEVTGILDSRKAAEESVDGFLMTAVGFQRFQSCVDDFDLLLYREAECFDVVGFRAHRDDGRSCDRRFRRAFLSRSGRIAAASQFLGQRKRFAIDGMLQLLHKNAGIYGRNLTSADINALHQPFHDIDNQKQQIDEIMRGRDLFLTNIVEQRFRFMRQGIQIVVADNTAIPFHIVEIAEQVIDEGVLFALGLLFQFKQTRIKAGDDIAGLVDEVFQMSFAEGCQGIRRQNGKRGDPFLAGHGRCAVLRRSRRHNGGSNLYRLFGSGFRVGGLLLDNGRRFFRRSGSCGSFFRSRGFRSGSRCSFRRRFCLFSGHDSVDLIDDMVGLHVPFAVGVFEILNHLTQGVGGFENDVHDVGSDNHRALAQFVKNIFRLVRKSVDAIETKETRRAFKGVHGAENVIQQREVVRSFFQLQEIGLDGFEMLLGFGNKICKKFRIKKILAHTIPSLYSKSPRRARKSYRLAQKHLYIPHHFFRLGGLDHIEVGPDVETRLNILFLSFRRKNNDGDILVGILHANIFDERKTVHARHVDVRDDEIDGVKIVQLFHGVEAVLCRADLEAFRLQHESDKVANGFGVVNDQDVLAHDEPACRNLDSL